MFFHIIFVESLFACLARFEVGFLRAFLEQMRIYHGHFDDLGTTLAVSQH